MLVGTLLILESNVFAASFDCKKASSTVEKLICSNPDLSTVDEILSTEFKIALSSNHAPELIKARQLDWLKNERAICTEVTCLQKVYANRIAELRNGAVKNKQDVGEIQEKVSGPLADGNYKFLNDQLSLEFSLSDAGWTLHEITLNEGKEGVSLKGAGEWFKVNPNGVEEDYSGPMGWYQFSVGSCDYEFDTPGETLMLRRSGCRNGEKDAEFSLKKVKADPRPENVAVTQSTTESTRFQDFSIGMLFKDALTIASSKCKIDKSDARIYIRPCYEVGGSPRAVELIFKLPPDYPAGSFDEQPLIQIVVSLGDYLPADFNELKTTLSNKYKLTYDITNQMIEDFNLSRRDSVSAIYDEGRISLNIVRSVVSLKSEVRLVYSSDEEASKLMKINAPNKFGSSAAKEL